MPLDLKKTAIELELFVVDDPYRYDIDNRPLLNFAINDVDIEDFVNAMETEIVAARDGEVDLLTKLNTISLDGLDIYNELSLAGKLGTGVDQLVRGQDLPAFASLVTYENLNANGDVGSGAGQVSPGVHEHAFSSIKTGGTYVNVTANELNQALEGISGTVTVANLDSLTTGADSIVDSLHRHSDNSTFVIPGTLIVGQKPYRFYFQKAVTIYKVRAWVNTPATGGSIRIDVLHGTAASHNPASLVSLFSTDGDKPTIAPGSYFDVSTVGIEGFTKTSFAQGDWMMVEIETVGPTVAGADLGVQLIYS